MLTEIILIFTLSGRTLNATTLKKTFKSHCNIDVSRDLGSKAGQLVWSLMMCNNMNNILRYDLIDRPGVLENYVPLNYNCLYDLSVHVERFWLSLDLEHWKDLYHLWIKNREGRVTRSYAKDASRKFWYQSGVYSGQDLSQH